MPRRNAAALLRVSTDLQELDSQREAIRAWAEREGARVRFYEEPATSGAAARRPVLDELLADARAGRFDVVVVSALDRIARDVVRLVMALDALERAGVSLVSLREGLDFRGPMGRAMASLLGAIAEIERAAIRSRVNAGLAAARAKGKTLGRPRYTMTGEELAEVRSLIGRGVSLRRIAREGLVKTFDARGNCKVPSVATMRRALAAVPA
jgi:DNA invertase Pin-like site-specific DNA recombinase